MTCSQFLIFCRICYSPALFYLFSGQVVKKINNLEHAMKSLVWTINQINFLTKSNIYNQRLSFKKHDSSQKTKLKNYFVSSGLRSSFGLSREG